MLSCITVRKEDNRSLSRGPVHAIDKTPIVAYYCPHGHAIFRILVLQQPLT